jgi:glutamine synthetase
LYHRPVGTDVRISCRAFAGVLDHMPALVAYTSPSAVSFLRLGPHHWSCGFASFGIENREAAIRICPSPATDPARAARGFNLEYRPGDATASPYMIVGALIQAGLSGVRRGLPLPTACPGDPSVLSEAERSELAVVPLPASLSEALAALEADSIARSWMPELMRSAYTSLKRLNRSSPTPRRPKSSAAAMPPPTDTGILGAYRRPRTVAARNKIFALSATP